MLFTKASDAAVDSKAPSKKERRSSYEQERSQRYRDTVTPLSSEPPNTRKADIRDARTQDKLLGNKMKLMHSIYICIMLTKVYQYII